MSNTIWKQLRAPFPEDVIQWRVGSKTQDGTRGLALPYIDARAVQDRLDAVLGYDGWEVRYRPCERPGSRGWICAITINHRELIHIAPLTREDGADESDIEPTKGAISDAFKRAAARFGVGRYLYDLDAVWHPIEKRGRSYVLAGAPPALPAWALPGGAEPGGAPVREAREAPSPSQQAHRAPESRSAGPEDEGWNPQPDPGEGEERPPEPYVDPADDPFGGVGLEPTPAEPWPDKGPTNYEVPAGVGSGSVSVPWQEPRVPENALCPIIDFSGPNGTPRPWVSNRIGFGKKLVEGRPMKDWLWAEVVATGSLEHDAATYLVWMIECKSVPDKKEWRDEHSDLISKAKGTILELAAKAF